MTQHDFLSKSGRLVGGGGGRKNSIARARERMFLPSLHWRYHKMIITTTIWWVHNWLNIKNCSERSLGSPCGWNDVLGWESSRGVFFRRGAKLLDEKEKWKKRKGEMRRTRKRWFLLLRMDAGAMDETGKIKANSFVVLQNLLFYDCS